MSRLTFVITCESCACNYLKAAVNRVIQCNLVELYVTRIHREITFGRETSNRSIGISSQGWSQVRGTHVLNSKRLCLLRVGGAYCCRKSEIWKETGGRFTHITSVWSYSRLCSTSSYVSVWRRLDPPLLTLARKYAENNPSIAPNLEYAFQIVKYKLRYLQYIDALAYRINIVWYTCTCTWNSFRSIALFHEYKFHTICLVRQFFLIFTTDTPLGVGQHVAVAVEGLSKGTYSISQYIASSAMLISD